MIYLQCTHAVLRMLGIREPLSHAPHAESTLGNWTVNDIPIDGRRALLFMSDRSLLSFPLLQGRSPVEMQDMPTFLAHGMSQLMAVLDVPKLAVDRLLRDVDTVALAKAPGRSLLAVHSAIAGDYARRIDRLGGIENCNLGDVISAVNRTPRVMLEGATPSEVSVELLTQRLR